MFPARLVKLDEMEHESMTEGREKGEMTLIVTAFLRTSLPPWPGPLAPCHPQVFQFRQKSLLLLPSWITSQKNPRERRR